MTKAIPTDRDVAVLGAGTMGMAIALVAAQAGHRVWLHDAMPASIDRALAALSSLLDKAVARGKLNPVEREACERRVRSAPSLEDLENVGLVIEAIVEDLDIKVALLRAAEAAVPADAILATNTSSLSVTALAGRLERPERPVGMHFFNPAHLMPLVEVVAGLASDEAILAAVEATARAWGKLPVRCRSTPGFIVNRIARPFYGEALRLLAVRAASPATVDAILREGAGFRMGPFELMDMIGHDVNFAVTRTVFDSTYGDPRYTPSLEQAELVAAGWLGRKSGRGFFDYRDDAPPVSADQMPQGPAPHSVVVRGDLGPAEALVSLAAEAKLNVTREAGDGSLLIDGSTLRLTDGRMVSQCRGAGEKICLFDLSPDYREAKRIALTGSPEAARIGAGFFHALGKRVSLVADEPGLVVARTIAMLANEAADALHQGIASPEAIDLSMRKGVNYPEGPLVWADRIGKDYIVGLIDNLAAAFGEDRYRASPLLRRAALDKQQFRSDLNA